MPLSAFPASPRKSPNGARRPVPRPATAVPSPPTSKFFLRISLAVFAVDRLTKVLALHTLHSVSTVPVLPGFFHLTLVHNTGVAFGLLPGWGLWVAVATFLVLAGLIGSVIRQGYLKQRLFCWGLGLVLGGAAGNLLDRVWNGAVIDFLDFRVWPVFNVADSCITFGAVLMGWVLLRRR